MNWRIGVAFIAGLAAAAAVGALALTIGTAIGHPPAEWQLIVAGFAIGLLVRIALYRWSEERRPRRRQGRRSDRERRPPPPGA